VNGRRICSKHKRHMWGAALAVEAGMAIAIAFLATLGDCDTPVNNV
jgi:hypothetical protein